MSGKGEKKKEEEKKKGEQDKQEKKGNKGEDSKKKVDFKDLVLKKLAGSVGLEALGTNGGMMNQGKWEQCH